jgi:hypothetical protein
MTNMDEIRQQMDLLTDDELITIIREHDEEQWRPEVFDIVASILNQRGVSQDKDSESDEDVWDDTANLNLMTVANYFNEADAEIDRLALEANDLKAWIVNKINADMATPVQLQVCKKDFAAALRILEFDPSELVPSSDLPAEIAEPPCPKCGSRKVMEQAEVAEPLETQPRPDNAWLYHCSSCGHKWAETSDS